MKILVINAGSSSLKYQLFNMENETVLAKGICERIGIENSQIKHTALDVVTVNVLPMKDHSDAIKNVIKALTDENSGVVSDLKEIEAVGHRVVHGGETFSSSVVINEYVKEAIRECIDLAPLHNPPNLVGIDAIEDIMPGVTQVAVFDTAFHQTVPQKSYMYAIPYDLYQRLKIRRYGFHGTSHRYVSQRAVELLRVSVEGLRIITCHLGNGSSVTAVKDGVSVATSMGFTPLSGVVMGTRSGSVDPAILQFLMSKESMSIESVTSLLNKESGVLGISGVSSDFRDLYAAAESGDERAVLSLEMFSCSVKEYIGRYAAVMGGLDVVIFTAGIGENTPKMRAKILEGLEFLDIELDERFNDEAKGIEAVISSLGSRVKVLVVPTNEELLIARDTKMLFEGLVKDI